MIETILTPTALWKSFELPENVSAKTIQEQNNGNIIETKLFIEGRKVKGGNVNIYAELIRNAKKSTMSAILLLEDFAINNNSSLKQDLLEKGYAVLTVDLAGHQDQKENYTEYPQSINYANYEVCKQDIYSIKKDAKATCWYEWSAVIKYAIKYLKDLPFISKVGAFGLSTVATALWQVIGSDQNLDATVLALNSGWLGYKGIYKFGGMVEPQFTTEMYQFIAGIDSQSYAMHIKKPTLLLSATNDNNFDVDRAQDIISKIPEQTFSAMHLSANYADKVNFTAYNNALIFFDKYLLDAKIDMPKGTEIKCDINNGKVYVEVHTDASLSPKVEIFVAEEKINPALRCWQKIEARKGQNGKFTGKFMPYIQSEIVFAYATVEYKNGLKLSTNIVSKRFEEEHVGSAFKSNILYSSRINNSHSIFVPANSGKSEEKLETTNNQIVQEKKGPMAISGVTCSGGLLTFALASKKYQPKDGSILMLDVYVKQAGELTVKLISNYFGDKTEYFVKVNLLGGDIWHNIKLEMNKFKTAEGMTLKDYSKIEALELSASEGEYLINNALWV